MNASSVRSGRADPKAQSRFGSTWLPRDDARQADRGPQRGEQRERLADARPWQAPPGPSRRSPGLSARGARGRAPSPRMPNRSVLRSGRARNHPRPPCRDHPRRTGLSVMSTNEAKPLPDADYLRSLLSYDVKTGLFSWKVNRRGRGARIGASAGTWKPSGYLSITIDGLHYPAHRVAWKMVTGCEPGPHVDHEDGDTRNNAFINLRDCENKSLNNFNSVMQSNNTSGYKDVFFHKASGLFRAVVSRLGRSYSFGYFKTASEANEAAISGRNTLHGEFACHGGR